MRRNTIQDLKKTEKINLFKKFQSGEMPDRMNASKKYVTEFFKEVDGVYILLDNFKPTDTKLTKEQFEARHKDQPGNKIYRTVIFKNYNKGKNK